MKKRRLNGAGDGIENGKFIIALYPAGWEDISTNLADRREKVAQLFSNLISAVEADGAIEGEQAEDIKYIISDYLERFSFVPSEVQEQSENYFYDNDTDY